MKTTRGAAANPFILAPIILATFLITATSPATAEQQAKPDGDRLSQDLDQLVAWIEGRFDNDLQVREDGAQEGIVRLHSLFVPQDLAELGEHVFYVQQSLDDNPRKIHRQRFYLFEADTEQEAIRLKVYAPPDPSALFDLHKEPSKRTGLKVADLGHEAGCDVLLTRKKRGRKGDHFAGAVAEGACREESSKYGKTLVITQEMYLDADEFWILEQARDTEGMLVYGPASGIPQKLHRAHTYRCQAEDRDADGTWQAPRPFEMHDQGSRLRIDPNRSGQLTAELSRIFVLGKSARAKPGEEALQLVIREKGNDAPIASAQGEPGAETIAAETADVKLSCKRQDIWRELGAGDP